MVDMCEAIKLVFVVDIMKNICHYLSKIAPAVAPNVTTSRRHSK